MTDVSAEGENGAAVIGAGVAGLVAAMYIARDGVPVKVFEGDPFDANDLPGGQLMLAEQVEFVPGQPDVQGPILMSNLQAQAEELGVEFVCARVQALRVEDAAWVLSSEEGESLAATVVMATGARPRFLGLGEEEYLGAGVSICATCDAPLYAERRVGVVGGGDTALEEALILARHASHVTVLHHRSELNAHPRLQKAAAAAPNIDILRDVAVTGLDGDGLVSAIRYTDLVGEKRSLAAEGLFLAAGRIPNTELVAELVERDAEGYILTSARGESSVAGLFACGECQDPTYRQYASAVGSGCRAGMEAARHVRSAHHRVLSTSTTGRGI